MSAASKPVRFGPIKRRAAEPKQPDPSAIVDALIRAGLVRDLSHDDYARAVLAVREAMRCG